MTGQTYVSRKKVEEQDCPSVNFFFMTKRDDSSSAFVISLTDGQKAYQGKLTDKEINDFSSKIKKTPEAYASLIHNAFSFGNNDMEFLYDLSEDDDTKATLSWRHNIGNGIKITLGNIKLQRTEPNNLMFEILSEACDQLRDCYASLKSMEKEQDRLKSDCEKAVKTLDSFVTEKQELEEQLYSKFVCILNKKKDKIQQLKQQIQSEEPRTGTQSGSMSGSETDHEVQKPTTNKNVHKNDLFESGSDVDSPQKQKETKIVGRRQVKASTSQKTQRDKMKKAPVKAEPSKMSTDDDDTDTLMDEF